MHSLNSICGHHCWAVKESASPVPSLLLLDGCPFAPIIQAAAWVFHIPFLPQGEAMQPRTRESTPGFSSSWLDSSKPKAEVNLKVKAVSSNLGKLSFSFLILKAYLHRSIHGDLEVHCRNFLCCRDLSCDFWDCTECWMFSHSHCWGRKRVFHLQEWQDVLLLP